MRFDFKVNLESVLAIYDCEVVEKIQANKRYTFYVLKSKKEDIWYDAVENSAGTVKVGYFWRDESKVREYVEKKVADVKSHDEMVAQWKAERKAKDDALADAVKVGDIYSSCWGYEANFYEYYEVVGKKGKMFVLRKLEVERVDKDPECGWASQGWFKPVAGKYVGEDIVRKLSSGGFKISSFEFAGKWDGVVREDANWH